MSSNNIRKPERGRLKSVFVARTIEVPQPKYEEFTNNIARRLGRRAVIETSSRAHLTFLDSGGPRAGFRRHRYNENDVREFSGDFRTYLSEQGFKAGSRVTINPDEPLGLYGRRERSIGVNLLPDEALVEQRTAIVEFLESRFGFVPPRLKSFNPHITIGEVKVPGSEIRSLRRSLTNTNGLVIPEAVAVNGLEVYLDQIEYPVGA